MKSSPIRVVVDEAVTDSEWRRFEIFAERKGIAVGDRLWLREAHPGMPDEHILHHLLDQSTILVTTDRPFHNRVLAAGMTSYYVGERAIAHKPLRGIHHQVKPLGPKKNLTLRESYHQPRTELRALLLPSSEKQLKRLHTKRRRIRNHFGGLMNLAEIAVTLSLRPLGSRTLIGVRIRVSSHVGIKALDASESYVAEPIAPGDRDLAAVAYALVAVIRLMLHSVKTRIYYDAVRIDPSPDRAADAAPARARQACQDLAACFEDLEFVPTPKGPFIERLRRKLDALARGNSNEILEGDVTEIMTRLAARRIQLTMPPTIDAHPPDPADGFQP